MEKGRLSIHTENILPIIKKWLYSDKDIFIRELIANAVDACTKHSRLALTGETGAEDAYSIKVMIDEDAKTLTFSDNGLGMTDAEVREYINQVAFSGAESFMEKVKQSGDSNIIGHFGLGFYSAFMVSSFVEIETLSYQEGSAPVHWSCGGGVDYEMREGARASRGTDVILHLNDEDAEFLRYYTVRGVIEKYCAFLPYPITLYEAGKTKDEDLDRFKQPLNNTSPLWRKPPRDCTEEEYKSFYRDVFRQFEEPLFWIHLNVDYPFNMQGILYFPRLKQRMEGMDGEIKLYNNQVFVADNLKEVIPEFLLLLKGVIDCPDLPLNVSRSFLQNDGTVKKVQQHITKKIADKLNELFKNERETYEGYWDDIAPFVRFGCLRDDKLYDMVKDALLFKNTDGKHLTLAEAREKAGDSLTYADDVDRQAFYIQNHTNAGIPVLVLDGPVDAPFLSLLEQKESGVKFSRIDSGLSDSLKGDGIELKKEPIEAILRRATGKDELKIELEPMKNEGLPAMLITDEQSRRFSEYAARWAGGAPFDADVKLMLNSNNKLVQKLAEIEDAEKADLVAAHLYDLALMQSRALTAKEMAAFSERGAKLMLLAVE